MLYTLMWMESPTWMTTCEWHLQLSIAHLGHCGCGKVAVARLSQPTTKYRSNPFPAWTSRRGRPSPISLLGLTDPAAAERHLYENFVPGPDSPLHFLSQNSTQGGA